MFLCKIFEQVEKKSSEHVDFVYGCGKQRTVMHKEVEKAIQCHREIEKEKKKLEGEVKRVRGKLSNEGFVSKAPEKVVNEEREKQVKYEEMLAKVCDMLETVKKKLK